MSRLHRSSQAGFTLPFIVIVALIVTIIIAEIVKVVQISSNQMVYFNSMDRTYRLAETALNQALGKLAVDSSTPFPGDWIYVSTENGHYQNLVTASTNPISGGVYIISSATRTVSGKRYSCRLHTYAAVSNVGSYFAATNTRLDISTGVRAGTGRIYSPILNFAIPSGFDDRIELLSANYVLGTPGLDCFPPTDWSIGTKAVINIAEPAGVNQPVGLQTPLIFPQILSADIVRYQNLAGPHTVRNVFRGDIYPPGFAEWDGSWAAAHPADLYGTVAGESHTNNNAHHVYFFDGDMRVEGQIHGQILFVATGDIYISSSIYNYPGTAPTDFPGHTVPTSSSTAHQAVLITRKSIIVDRTFYSGPIPPVQVATQTIHALMLAPNADLYPLAYPNGNNVNGVHFSLSLDFEGAMVVGSVSNFNQVFRNNRSYRYMGNLLTHPPPYLPAVADIRYSLEETTSEVSLYP